MKNKNTKHVNLTNEKNVYSSAKHGKAKHAVFAVAIVLLVILAAGLALQAFMPAGKKVSDWFSKNETNALIVEGEKVSALYGNVYKTRNDVLVMLHDLNWTEAEENDGGFSTLKLCTFGSENGIESCLYAVKSGTELTNPNVYPYVSKTDPYSILYGSFASTDSKIWRQGLGWILSCAREIPVARTVKAVYQQEVWKDFISQNSFVSVAENADEKLINAGEFIAGVKFKGTNDEIEQMLSKLDWTQASSGSSSTILTLPLISISGGNGDSYTYLYAVKDTAASEHPYKINRSEPYGACVWVYEGNHDSIIQLCFLVYEVHQQDIWSENIVKIPYAG